MSDRTKFSEVRRRLRPGDVFQRAEHEWKTQTDRRWKGSCPWHESTSGTCFSVNPETLEWHCFSCERGGGPLEYVAELKRIGGGAEGSLDGKDFFRAWEALARHAGCAGPGELEETGGKGSSGRKRRPLRNPTPREPSQKPRPPTKPAAGGSASGDVPSQARVSSQNRVPSRTAPEDPDPDTPESELRAALSRYRKALKNSEKAKSYVEGRGLHAELLRAYGCGYAPPGEWPQDDSPKHRWDAGRIVTPLTTPGGRLLNLHARAVGECPRKKRHRYWPGNPTPPAAYFNALAIVEGDGPLVICEGPMDALSFIAEGHERTVALYNTDGVPWTALRGHVDTVVFAFDHDEESETGQTDAPKRARAAVRRGYDAHTLHDEASYEGHADPNDALQAGDLTLGYLEELRERSRAAPSGAEGQEAATDGRNAGEEAATPAELVAHWPGDDIGYLGRWLWERGGVPDGPVGPGGASGRLYADRALHEWIKEALEAGPHGTSEQEAERLRWALWRLYAAHGPEEVPAWQIPDPPEEAHPAGGKADQTGRRRDPYRLGQLPKRVEAERTDAPRSNPHPGKRGLALRSPYSEPFVRELKRALPRWGREWRGSEEVWVIDDCFAALAGDLCREHFS